MTNATLRDANTLLLDGSKVLARMSHNGIRVDVPRLEHSIQTSTQRIADLALELERDEVFTVWRRVFGEKRNLNSLTQLTEVLFGAMKIPYEGQLTAKAKRWQATEEVIRSVGIPFTERYGIYRDEHDLKARLEGLRRETVEGFLHPVFNIHSAKTYRSSSGAGRTREAGAGSDFNLQSVPARDAAKAEVIRSCLVPRRGRVLIENDFASHEFKGAACVVGSTLIETISGPRTIRQVSHQVEAGEKVYVYGYSHEKGRVAVAEVLDAGITRRLAKVYRVTLDNGKSVVTTADHKFLLRDGQYVELRKLKPGDSLMPFYRDYKVVPNGTVYSKIYLNNGLSILGHNLVAEDVFGVTIAGSKMVVHHKDGNGTNNGLDNIEVMTRNEHMRIHSVQGWERHPERRAEMAERSRSEEARERSRQVNRDRKKNWTKERWEEWKQRIRESYKRRGTPVGEKNAMYGRKHSEESKRKMSEKKKGKMPKMAGWNKGLTQADHDGIRRATEKNKGKPAWNKGLKLPPLSAERKRQISEQHRGRKRPADAVRASAEGLRRFWVTKPDEVCGICGEVYRTVTPGHLRCSHQMTMKEYREKYNHKVVSIKPCGKQDVYNLTVEGIHNYAVEAGVVIKNCRWQDPVMLAYASDPAKDIHRDAAALCYWCEPEQVSKEMRNGAKNQFVFATLYGSYHKQTAPGLWKYMLDHKIKLKDGTPVKKHLRDKGIRTLGLCLHGAPTEPGTFEHRVKEAEQSYLQLFSHYTRERDRQYRDYLKRGWFRMMTGFIIRGVVDRNFFLNADIQGSCFHCLLLTLILAQRQISRRRMRALLVGQVHDCALGDVPEEETQEYIGIIEEVVERDLPRHWDWITIPLKVESEVCEKSWWGKQSWEKHDGVWGPKAS